MLQYFHLGSSEAAAVMGMGLTKFKSKIRELGISRWPGRWDTIGCVFDHAVRYMVSGGISLLFY